MISPADVGVETPTQNVTDDAVNQSSRPNLAGFALSWEGLSYGAILSLALLLRLFSLGANGLDQDEIFSVLLARQHLPIFWKIVTHAEANMVLYYVILRFWIHFGQSEFAIRSLSVVTAVAAVAVLYSVATRAFGRRAGILGALLFAINGFSIQYSQWTRSYSLLVLLVTLSSSFFLKSVHEDSRRNWILYIIVSTLAIYAHVFAVFVLMAHWVSLLFAPRRQAIWRRLLPSTAVIGLLALPIGLSMLFRDHGQNAWIPKTTVAVVYHLFTRLAGGPDYDPGYGSAILLLIYAIPVIIALLALVPSRTWSLDHNEAWHAAFFLTWLVVPILLDLVISVRKPMFLDRYLIICLPPFILLASYGCTRLRRVGHLVPLLCAIVGLTVPGLHGYYRYRGEDWRRVAQYILSNGKPGDAAVFCPSLYYGSRLAYYLHIEPTRLASTLVLDADPAATGGDILAGPELTLLLPKDENSFRSLAQDLSSRYGRVWFINTGEAAQGDVAVQQRTIRGSLANEFRGISSEKRFSSNNFVVDLYEGKGSGRRPEPSTVVTVSNTIQTPQPGPRSVPSNDKAVETPMAQAGKSETAKIHITSSPARGEIYVDGKFFGDTPSDITLPAGERVVKITIGPKAWTRSIEITPGQITLHADMTGQ